MQNNTVVTGAFMIGIETRMHISSIYFFEKINTDRVSHLSGDDTSLVPDRGGVCPPPPPALMGALPTSLLARPFAL